MGCVTTSRPDPQGRSSPNRNPSLPNATNGSPAPEMKPHDANKIDNESNHSDRPKWDYSRPPPPQQGELEVKDHHPPIKQSSVEIEVEFSSSNPGQAQI